MKDDRGRKLPLFRDRKPSLSAAEVRAAERLAQSRPDVSTAEPRKAALVGKRKQPETGWQMLERALYSGRRVLNRTLKNLFQLRGVRK
jgi:hypothetical protein